jgi:ABC-type glycerol-3-phosphate transport system permease component
MRLYSHVNADDELVGALALAATAPLFVLGLALQRPFVRGLALGAVRG